MAKIYPERFPQWAKDDPKRSAERRVYKAVSMLPDEYTVFYSTAWQVRDPRSGAQDGEADFIIAHPEMGAMILEVKGGGIRYDPQEMQWYSLDRSNVEHSIKDPVQQVRKSKDALISKLRELPKWGGRYLTIAYMLVFPDVRISNVALRPDLPRALLIDSEDLAHIAERVEAGFEWCYGEEKRRGALGVDGVRLLESFLARSFTLRSRLGVELEQDEARILELTERQMSFLHFIQSHRRALIEGCAGSGKTTLALEKARQLSEQGFDTLLLCFNVPLAEYLRQRVPAGVDVFHFHGLCKHLRAEMVRLGLLNLENEKQYDQLTYLDEQYINDQLLPELLLQAVLELGPLYDAIIVDEGQDFRDEWWEIIIELLRDKDNGIWYVFFDNNQNIYNRHANLEKLITIPPFTLSENCRNTRTIYEVVRQLHTNPQSITSFGPPGRPPEIFYFATKKEQEDTLKRVLHRYVNEEGVQTSHITLLTTRKPSSTVCAPGKKLGNFLLTEWMDSDQDQDKIRVTSVYRFKGLENRVIVLTGFEDVNPSKINQLLYVACSRARTHLIIVAHGSCREFIEPILEKAKS